MVDITGLAIGDLYRRKLRTFLNLIGIVIGCIVLLMTAAGTAGAGRAIQAIFDSSEFAREIRVSTRGYYGEEPPEGEIVVEGEMDEERKQRIHDALVEKWREDQRTPQDWYLTRDEIDQLNDIPEVVRVVTDTYLDGILDFDGDERSVTVFGADIHSPGFRERLLLGEPLTDKNRHDHVLVDEFMAYQLGYRSDEQLNSLIGRKIRFRMQIKGTKIGSMYQYLTGQYEGDHAESLREQIEFATAVADLVADLDRTTLSDQQKEMIRRATKEVAGSISTTPEHDESPEAIEIVHEFTICGVVQYGETNDALANMFRMWFHGSHGDFFLHHKTAGQLQGLNPSRTEEYYHAKLVVSSTSHLEAVTDQVSEQGLSVNSALDIMSNIQWRIDNAQWYIYGFAVTVLLASAIGISNTLVIAVLQRRPEFGILKAIGARDKDVVLLMLCEGVFLGILGASAAWLISWIVAVIGHQWIINQIGIDLTDGDGSLFDFRIEAIALMYLISIGICVGASLLPAWRAARLDPVVAMRRT